MTKNVQPRNYLRYATSGGVILVLALIVLLAALAPPAPEKVVSDLLVGFANQDRVAVENAVTSPLFAEIMLSAETSDSPWPLFWSDGQRLFEDFRIADAVVEGDRATITVLYGPGFIRVQDFQLQREGKSWLVVGLGD